MKTTLSILLAILSICLAGCPGISGLVVPTHYALEQGKWAFISYNEGVGRQVEYIGNGVDSASFTQIDPEHAKDKRAVYYRSMIIPKADPASIRHLFGRYWRDDHAVFLLTNLVPGADPSTFHLLSVEPWAADAKGVFFSYFQVPVQDPATFQLINYDWAKDAHRYYSPDVRGDIVDCDYSSLTFLNAKYAKDKAKLYWCGQEIKGADYSSFEARNEETAHDRFRRYRGATEFWEDVKARRGNEPNQAPEPTPTSRGGSF